MSKKDKEKLDKENKCNCDESCTCGCQEGYECNCEHDDCSCGHDDCSCGHDECSCEEESGCSGHCEGCSGCGGVDPETLIQILGARNEELEEKYMRLQAEYLNFKTRTQSEISKMLLYEGEDFIKEILNIKDNFERAISMDDNDLSDEVSKFLSGFKMILGNLTALLDKFEVKEVDCLGLEFDPHVAEAVLVDHDEAKPENVVLEVLTKGYKYKDKLIRPAMVKVNK